MPPRNYRRIEPCCCANCRHFGLDADSEAYFCRRAPHQIAGYWNALQPEVHVCDLHVREKILEVVR